MKKIFLIVSGTALAFLGSVLAFSSCEKDDICDPNTPTTPQLVIDFYDINHPKVLKIVPNLRVYGGDHTDSIPGTANVSTIKIPLQTLADITKFRFVKTDSITGKDNGDMVEFDYTRQNQYISRACGFKTVFTLKANQPILTDGPTSDGIWIKADTLTTNNIINENAAHLKIYF